MRIVIVSCCTLIATLAVAAPAPLPRRQRPDTTGPWVVGWDRPVEPAGCKFIRRGTRLLLDIDAVCRPENEVNPVLERVVHGNFVATVRVRLAEGYEFDKDQSLYFGLRLHAKNASATVGPQVHYVQPGQQSWAMRSVYNVPRSISIFGRGFEQDDLLAAGCGVYLRIYRSGNSLFTSHSGNGWKWEDDVASKFDGELPKEMRLGVFAAWLGKAKLRATFDEFVLTAK